MKTIKAITDFGILDVKCIGCKREIRGEYWQVCEVPTQYMNAKEPLIMRRVLHYKTGANLPIREVGFNSSGKRYLEAAETFLSNIPDDAIKTELNKYEILNNELGKI